MVWGPVAISPPSLPHPLALAPGQARHLRPPQAGFDAPHSHTHLYIHTYIYIYKGVHPPPLKSIPFRPPLT
ncbi:hypothetical protein Hanom_Chr04g00364691 [Helianthus anomalus]